MSNNYPRTQLRPGQLRIKDEDICQVVPGEIVTEEGIFLAAGGFHALYRGELTDFMEKCLFRRCFKDAISKIIRHGSDTAVQVANQWINILYARTNRSDG